MVDAQGGYEKQARFLILKSPVTRRTRNDLRPKDRRSKRA